MNLNLLFIILCIILVFALLFYKTNEYFSQDSIQNISSLYNTNNLTITNATITKLNVANFIPSGLIVAWTGNVPPSGWLLCDGTKGTPNLQNSFILCAGVPSVNLNDIITSESNTGQSTSIITISSYTTSTNPWTSNVALSYSALYSQLDFTNGNVGSYIQLNCGTQQPGNYTITYNALYNNDHCIYSLTELTTGTILVASFDAYTTTSSQYTQSYTFNFPNTSPMIFQWKVIGKNNASNNYYITLFNYVALTNNSVSSEETSYTLNQTGNTHILGQTGGSSNITLSMSNMPIHNHEYTFRITNSTEANQDNCSGSNLVNNEWLGTTATQTGISGSTTPTPLPTMPPYYVVAFIMKQ